MPRRKSSEPLDNSDAGGAVAVLDPEKAAEASSSASAPPLQRMKISEYHDLDIWSARAKMNEADWADKLQYVYRSDPFTVSKHTKQRYGYLFKGGFPGMSEDEIARTFGGGRFRSYLTQGRVQLVNGYCEGRGKPILRDDEELMITPLEDEPETAPSDFSNPIIDKLLTAVLEQKRVRAEDSGDKETASALQRAIGLVADGAGKAQEMIASANKAPTLNEQFEMVKNIMALAAPKQSDFTEKLLLKLLDHSFTPAVAAPQINPVDNLTSTMELIDQLQDKFGGAARGDWKSTVAQAVIQALPSVIKELGGIARAMQQRPQVILPPGAFIPQHAPAPVAAVPPTFNVNATPPGMAAPPAEVPGSAPQAPPNGVPAVTTPALDAVKNRLVLMFFRGKGGDLAASFIEEVAPAMYEQLKGKTADELLAVMPVDPILAQIAIQDGIKEWVKELVDYIAEEETEVPTIEPATAPVN